MSHLLLVEKHQQLLIRNVEARPIREIHTAAPGIHVSEMPKRPSHNFKCKQPFKPKYTPRKTPRKPHHSHSQSQKEVCHKCSRKGHFARACKAPPYLIKMYKELQTLRGRQRETHALDTLSISEIDTEKYMAINEGIQTQANITSLDSTSTHTNSTFSLNLLTDII